VARNRKSQPKHSSGSHLCSRIRKQPILRITRLSSVFLLEYGHRRNLEIVSRFAQLRACLSLSACFFLSSPLRVELSYSTACIAYVRFCIFLYFYVIFDILRYYASGCLSSIKLKPVLLKMETNILGRLFTLQKRR
jgi:hypothetical protein